jgi:adenylate cyclase
VKQQKVRVLVPIGLKLVSIISILVVLSLGAVIVTVSVISTQDVQRTAEDNNFTVNRRAGSQAESSFKSVQAAVLFYLEMLDHISAASYRDQAIERQFFNHNVNIAAIWVKGPGSGAFIPNEQFFLSNSVSAGAVEAYFASGVSAVSGRTRLVNASPQFGLSLISAAFVREGRAGTETIRILFTADDLSETFGTGINTSFIITDSG